MKKVVPCLCMLLAIASLACEKDAKANKKPKEKPPVAVSAALAVQREVPVRITSIGTVEALSTVSVSSRVEGAIESAHFSEGQDVRKGQLLFTIDRRPFAAVLEGAQANLQKDLALLDEYRKERDRAETIYKQDLISRQDYDQAVTKAASQKAVIAADQAAVDAARLTLGYCEIRAPLSGRTGPLLVNPGNVVKADPASALVVIRQVQPINVRFSVPQKDLMAVRQARARNTLVVRAKLPGPNSGDAANGGLMESGTLSFLDSQVDAATGAVMLKALFPNGQKILWPGQFVEVGLDLSTRSALLVPAQAVQTGPDGPFVFVVTAKKTASVRTVSPGETLGDDMVILNGLEPGEMVVTAGHLLLTPGAKVEVVQDSPSPGNDKGKAGPAGAGPASGKAQGEDPTRSGGRS